MTNRTRLTNIATWVSIYLLVTGFFYLASDTFFKPKPPEPEVPRLLIQVDDELDWQRGPAEAPLTLVEYSDFQCGACQSYYPLLKQAKEEIGDDLRVVYRHTPAREDHEHAEIMALASEAAGNQEKFWEMHDLIFERTGEWSEANTEDARSLVITFAEELELDVPAFEADLDNEETLRNVEGDLFGGLASGVRATPTFFLNGEVIALPEDADGIVSLLTAQLPQDESNSEKAE